MLTVLVIMMVIVFVMAIFIGLQESLENLGKDKDAYTSPLESSFSYLWDDYKEVVKSLELAGFENIETVDLNDASFFKKENTVSSISINGVDDFSTLSLDAFIDLISERMVEIIRNLNSANISVFDYNSLYILALKNESRFSDYMTAQMKRSGIIIDNAMKNGEIKNGISTDFIKRVLLDIWGRTSSLGTTDDVAKLNDLLDDIRTFKQLIKGEI